MDVEYEKERVSQQPEGSGGKKNVTIKITIGFSLVATVVYLLFKSFFPDSRVTEWLDQIRRYATETENGTENESVTETQESIVPNVKREVKIPHIREKEPVPEPSYAFVTTADVNFRNGNSKNSGILNVIPAGTVLNLIDEITHNGYYYVHYRGQDGYVWCDCVEPVFAQTESVAEAW